MKLGQSKNSDDWLPNVRPQTYYNSIPHVLRWVLTLILKCLLPPSYGDDRLLNECNMY